MLEDGSKLRDVLVLADEGAELTFAIDVTRMPRLLDLLAAPTGRAHGTVTFGRDRGFAVARVDVTADLTLQCQRCLKPLVTEVQGESQVFLLESEADAERAPAEVETMVAQEGRLRIAELVEEDLLLALPVAPRHERASECATSVKVLQPEAAKPDVQRPFASLNELLGRDEPKRRQ
ncbi:MAG: YceD family protein [Pseudomonadota bacterium]